MPGLWTAPSRIVIVILIPCGELHTIVTCQTVACIEEKKINKDKKNKQIRINLPPFVFFGIVQDTNGLNFHFSNTYL